MQRTAISNPYMMESQPKVRTPIDFEIGADRAHCHGCGRNVLPRIIKSRFIGGRHHRMAICPHCCSVIQAPPPEPKPKKLQSVFVWHCDDCGKDYDENSRLPKAESETGRLVRLCRNCFGLVRMMEKQS